MIEMPETLRQWLAAEPFTLTMSSGFFGFFAHCGMLSALEEHGLHPKRLTGSSAGALVGACWAAGCDTATLRDALFALSRKDFWDPGPGLGYLRGKLFREIIAGLAPVQRLENCPTPISLSVYDGFARKTRVLERGLLPQAVAASCAVPILFHPIKIGQRLYWDGGIGDRHGLAGLNPGDRIFYHHLSSRSPWRRKNSDALQIPNWPNLCALSIDGLPRSGPSRLDEGRKAWNCARDATLQALDMPLLIAGQGAASLQMVSPEKI